ncbi:hypothetical protein ACQJBY_036124 [Aegilops geniculata]
MRVLRLHWENEEGKSVLDRLVPPRTLENFWLVGYRSRDFPGWMFRISSYLPFLSELTLDGLEGCDCLPSFGALPNLRKLCLRNIPNIKKVGKEFYGEGGPCMKLRVLQLISIENLVEWSTTESSKENEEFLIPNLHHLEIMDCPKLKFVPYPPRSVFWALNNSETVLPVQGCFTSPTELYLFTLKNIEKLSVWFGHINSLEVLEIRDCCNMTSLPESIKNLTTLKKLRLDVCEALEA